MNVGEANAAARVLAALPPDVDEATAAAAAALADRAGKALQVTGSKFWPRS